MATTLWFVVGHQPAHRLLSCRKAFVDLAVLTQHPADAAAVAPYADLLAGLGVQRERLAPSLQCDLRLLLRHQTAAVQHTSPVHWRPLALRHLLLEGLPGSRSLIGLSPLPRVLRPIQPATPSGHGVRVDYLGPRARCLLVQLGTTGSLRQRQVLHPRLGGQHRLDRLTAVLRPVALVELRGKLQRTPSQLLAQLRRRHRLSLRQPDHQAVHPPERMGCRRRERHLRVRRRRVVELVQVPLDQLHGLQFVAGAGQEHHVIRVLTQLADPAAQDAVGLPVRVDRLGMHALGNIGRQQRGQHLLRLFGAGQLPVQHVHGQRDGVRRPSDAGQVVHLRCRVAADAVRQVVAGCGRPEPEVLGRRVRITDVVRDQPPVLMYGVHAVAADLPPPLHVVQYGVRPVQRDLGELGQRAGRVLEAPVEQVRVVLVLGRVRIPVRHTPCERHQRLPRLPTHHVRRDERQTTVEPQVVLTGRVSPPYDVLQQSGPCLPVRRTLGALKPVDQFLVHRVGSSWVGTA